MRGTVVARIVSLLAKCVLMLLFLAALSLGLLAGYRWVTTTELFAVERVDIRGNRVLSDRRIREVAGLARGKNIFEVNMGRVEHRLSSSGWIDSVLVRRSLPDTLLLKVEERRPVFWIKRDEAIYYADAKGSPIAPVRTGTFISLPFLRLSDGGGQSREQLEVLYTRLQNRSLPFTLAQLAWIRFFSGEIVELHLMDRSLRICVGGSSLRDNLNTLGAVWHDLRERDELKRTQRILVYGTRGWVKFDPGTQFSQN
jgi:cell division protein FtsQ